MDAFVFLDILKLILLLHKIVNNVIIGVLNVQLLVYSAHVITLNILYIVLLFINII